MRLEHRIGVIILVIFTVIGWLTRQTVDFTPATSTPTSTIPIIILATSSHAITDGWVLATGSTTTNALVVRVVDGDTIEVRRDEDTVNEKVRFLGINTPESVDPRRPVQCFGKEASSFNKQLLEHQRVRLEPDPQADERDKYHRLLRNIKLEDGTDVNASLVSLGYAQAYLSFPLNALRKQQLRQLETNARVGERGLWNPATCAGQK